VRLEPPHIHTLEQAIEWIGDDELVEVTPKSIRIRKRYLNADVRKRMSKKAVEADESAG
jgi:GTP-binding protein